MRNKGILRAFAFSAVICAMTTFSVTAMAEGVSVETHSEDEIRSYVSSHPYRNELEEWKANGYQNTEVSFKVKPDPQNGVIGRVSDSDIQEPLNALNVMRYIAGLDEVTLSEEYIELAQAAADVNGVSGVMSHMPSKPSAIPDSLYNKGAEGASSSNLAYASYGGFFSQIEGYMDDSGRGNVERLGHRRWCLNPAMRYTGFGTYGNQSAMYAFDNVFTPTDTYGVVWPAQNMPVDYFSEEVPWSYSRGEKISDPEAVSVTLTRISDKKRWSFSSSGGDGYFTIENSYYGQPGCVIFLPNDISYNAGDVFDVSITGLDIPVNYTVSFFGLAKTIPGDADGNGKVTANDAVLILKYNAGLNVSFDTAAADINGDGKINVRDAVAVLKQSAGIKI